MSDNDPVPKGEVIEVPFDKLTPEGKTSRVNTVADNYFRTVEARLETLKTKGQLSTADEIALTYSAINRINLMYNRVSGDLTYDILTGSGVGDRNKATQTVQNPVVSQQNPVEILEDVRLKAFFHPASLAKRNIHEQMKNWKMCQLQLVCALAQDIITQDSDLGMLVEGKINDEWDSIDDTLVNYSDSQGGLPNHLLDATKIYYYMRKIVMVGEDTEFGKESKMKIGMWGNSFVHSYCSEVIGSKQVDHVLGYGFGLKLGENRLEKLMF